MKFRKLQRYIKRHAALKKFKGSRTHHYLVEEKAAFLRETHVKLSTIVAAWLDVDRDSGLFSERLGKLKGRYDWEETLGDDENAVEVFKKFLAPGGYKLPDHPLELRSDLEILYEYYSKVAPSLDNIPVPLLSRIDFVMAQIAGGAHSWISLLLNDGQRMDIIEKLNIGRKSAKEERAQPIYEVFYRMDITEMSLNRIVTEIRTQLEKENEGHIRKTKVPSVDTIRRALLRDPDISRILKEKNDHKNLAKY